MVYKTTAKKLLADLEAGVGNGTGDAYEPWIKVTKRNTSSRSNQSIAKMPGLNRHCHFLSRGEKDLAHTLLWLGVADVREQFPLFPWEHTHPANRVDKGRDWGVHPGMRAVAQDAGITLPVYPRLQLPIVLTLDIMATVHWPDGEFRNLFGYSCKAKPEVTKGHQTVSLFERLELDRRYCEAGNLPHLLVFPELLPGRLPRELEALAPIATRANIEAARADYTYLKFVENLEETSYQKPACVAAKEAGQKIGWGYQQSGSALKLAMWSQDVDADLSRRTNLATPLVRGGRRLRAELRRTLLGVSGED